MCVLFFSSFVCMSAYANVYFKKKLWECLRAGLPPGFPSTAPPPVRVLAVLGTLAVWISNQKYICTYIYILILIHEMNNETYKKQIQQIRQNRKLIAVLGVRCPFILRAQAHRCVFCIISLLSVYMCVRMPLSLRSVAGVPSSQALPGYLITAHHLCAFLMYFAH